MSHPAANLVGTMWRRALQGTAVAVATVIVLLRGGELPSKPFWARNAALFVVAALVLGVAAFSDVVASVRRERGLALELEVLDVLKAAHIRIIEATGLDWKEVGLHAFLVGRTLRRPWEPVLVRVARWRLRSTPPSTGIRWTPGKGVIGACWEQRADVAANLTEAWGDDPDGMTEAEWSQLPHELRYGLSYDEYNRVRSYGAIVASPILLDGAFEGCVSADAPGDSFEALRTDAVREILQHAALHVSRTTAPLSNR